MSLLPAGSYRIYNRILSPAGQTLAITYNGPDQFATVEPLSTYDNQVWEVQDFDAYTQFIIPKADQYLEAAWGDQGVKVIEAGNYVWTIREGDDGYTIQDGGLTVNWGVSYGLPGEKVTITKDEYGPNQRWIFEKA